LAVQLDYQAIVIYGFTAMSLLSKKNKE